MSHFLEQSSRELSSDLLVGTRCRGCRKGLSEFSEAVGRVRYNMGETDDLEGRCGAGRGEVTGGSGEDGRGA